MSESSAPFSVLVAHTIIFLLVSLLFLFPSNKWCPLDRRLIGLFGAALCGISEGLSRPDATNQLLFIDYNVLIILIALMVINYIVMQQYIFKNIINYMQDTLRSDINKGYWVVCLLSFILSPLFMNDGVCLLLVDPVLDAFIPIPSEEDNSSLNRIDNHRDSMGSNTDARACDNSRSNSSNRVEQRLPSGAYNLKIGHQESSHITDDLKISEDHKTNRFYILLGLACSSNIGSVVAFCGNPQNIIIAEHLMSSSDDGSTAHPTLLYGYQFFGFMLIPAILCWLITVFVINRFRIQVMQTNQRSHVTTSTTISNIHSERLSNNIRSDNDGTSSPRHRIDLSDETDNQISKLSTTGDSIIQELSIKSEVESSYNRSSHPNPVSSQVPNDNNQNSDAATKAELIELGRAIVGSNQLLASAWFLLLIFLQFSSYVPLTQAYAMISICMPATIILANYYYNEYRSLKHLREMFARFREEVYIHFYIFLHGHEPSFTHMMAHTSSHHDHEEDELYLHALEIMHHDESHTSQHGNESTIDTNNQHHSETDSAKLASDSRKFFIDSIHIYTESLFNCIDYNLLFIFIGLFIVSGYFVETKIPAQLW